MRLLFDNLPRSLRSEREVLARCLEAMNGVMPLRAVYLFSSHARGEAGPDSDVDLCILADGAERQLETARRLREAIWRTGMAPSLCHNRDVESGLWRRPPTFRKRHVPWAFDEHWRWTGGRRK